MTNGHCMERIGRMLKAIEDGDDELKEYHKKKGRE